MAVCLNPLKSGPTFGFSAYEAPDGTIFMSQSPQIGSYLRFLSSPELSTKASFVSIPSNRVLPSVAKRKQELFLIGLVSIPSNRVLPSVFKMSALGVGFLGSQSPQIGSYLRF